MVHRAFTAVVLGATVLSFILFFRETLHLSLRVASLHSYLGASMAEQASGLSSLELSLEQPDTSSPTLKVNLRNTSPDTPFTILTWDTPLDPKALALGVFRMVDASSGSELLAMNMKLNRKLPPSRDQLIEIGPGKDYSTEVKFEPPLAQLHKGKSYVIQAIGRWKGVWPVAASELNESDLNELGGGSRCLTGDFQSDKVTLAVE